MGCDGARAVVRSAIGEDGSWARWGCPWIHNRNIIGCLEPIGRLRFSTRPGWCVRRYRAHAPSRRLSDNDTVPATAMSNTTA